MSQEAVQDYREQLDYLLDFSRISHEHREGGAIDFSISKDKLNLSQKERTRQESFEDILKQIKQAKIQQSALNNQLGTLKRRTYEAFLGPFQEQFSQLNHENVALRDELNQYRRKVKEDKSERISNRSSIKVRSSINSTYGDQNKKTNAKPGRKAASPNMLLKRKQAKITESTSNLGCSQVVSPRVHRRRESQLTERKNEENSNFNSVGISVNASYYEQKASQFNMKESVSKGHLRNDSFEQKNVFVQILGKMLVQQRIRDEDKYCELYLEMGQKKIQTRTKAEVVYINELEQEIKISNEKLQMISLIMKRFQSEIEEMNVNLKSVDEEFKRLWAVKGHFLQMEKQCVELHGLRREVSQKEELLGRKKENLVSQTHEQKAIVSVQTLIKLITNNPNKVFANKSSNLYCSYYREVRQLFKVNKDEQNRKQLKMTKVREMIDNIRQGRKKFNELIAIYEGRIAKLEEKIGRVRGEQALRGDRVQRSGGSGRK